MLNDPYELNRKLTEISGPCELRRSTLEQRLALEIQQTTEGLEKMKELQDLLNQNPAIKRCLDLVRDVGVC